MTEGKFSRRDFLKLGGLGLGGLALSQVRGVEAAGLPEASKQDFLAQVSATPTEKGWNFKVNAALSKPASTEIRVMQVPIRKISVGGAAGGEMTGSVETYYDANSNTWSETKNVVDQVSVRETTLIPQWEDAKVLATGNGSYDLPDLAGDMSYVFAAVDQGGFDPTKSRLQLFTTPERNRQGADNFLYPTLLEI